MKADLYFDHDMQKFFSWLQCTFIWRKKTGVILLATLHSSLTKWMPFSLSKFHLLILTHHLDIFLLKKTLAVWLSYMHELRLFKIKFQDKILFSVLLISIVWWKMLQNSRPISDIHKMFSFHFGIFDEKK